MSLLIQPGFEDELGQITPTTVIDSVQDPVKSGRDLAKMLMNQGAEPVKFVGTDVYSQVGKKISPRKFAGMSTSEALDPFEWLARSQSTSDKWGNALAKMLITAGTTFLDGTVGTIWGTGEALAGGSFINNQFSDAMARLNKWSEEVLPNFYTREEQDNPWYTQLGTANFWADKFMKNFGFTVGAVYSGMAWSGATQALLRSKKIARRVAQGLAKKGVERGDVSKIMQAMKQGKLVGSIPEELAKDAKLLSRHNHIMYSVGGISGAQGESRIGAINNARDFEEAQLQQVEQNLSGKLPEYEKEGKGLGLQGKDLENYVKERYDKDLDVEKERLRPYVDGFRNANFLMDFVVLSLGNIAQFRTAFSGGYDLQRQLAANAKRYLQKEPIDGITTMSKLSVNTPKGFLKNAQDILVRTGKVTKNGMWEGFEEFSQDVVEKTGTRFYSAQFDPEATDSVNGYFREFFKSFLENATNPDEWESGFIGFLTGMLGAPIIGKSGFSMSGGVWEQIQESKNSKKHAQQMADAWNSMVESPEFKSAYMNRVASEAAQNDMDAKLEANDIVGFENAEHRKFVLDVMTAIDSEMFEDMLHYYETLGQQDTEFLRESVKLSRDKDGNEIPLDDRKGPMDNWSAAEIKDFFSKRGSTLADMAKTVREIYDALEVKLPHASDKEVRKQITYYATSAKNTQERVNEILNSLSKISEDNPGVLNIRNAAETVMGIESEWVEYLLTQMDAETKVVGKEKVQEDTEKEGTDSSDETDSKGTKSPTGKVEIEVIAKHKDTDKGKELVRRQKEAINVLEGLVNKYNHVLKQHGDTSIIDRLSTLRELTHQSTILTLTYKMAMEDGGPETMRKYFDGINARVEEFNKLVEEYEEELAEISEIDSEELRDLAAKTYLAKEWEPVSGRVGIVKARGRLKVRLRGLDETLFEELREKNPDTPVEELFAKAERELTKDYIVVQPQEGELILREVTSENETIGKLQLGHLVKLKAGEDGTLANAIIVHPVLGDYAVSNIEITQTAQEYHDAIVRYAAVNKYENSIKEHTARLEALHSRIEAIENVSQHFSRMLAKAASNISRRTSVSVKGLNPVEQEYVKKVLQGISDKDITTGSVVMGVKLLERAIDNLQNIYAEGLLLIEELNNINESIEQDRKDAEALGKGISKIDNVLENIGKVARETLKETSKLVSDANEQIEKKMHGLQSVKASVSDIISNLSKNSQASKLVSKALKKLDSAKTLEDVADILRDISKVVIAANLKSKVTPEQLENLQKELEDITSLLESKKNAVDNIEKTVKDIYLEISKLYTWSEGRNPFMDTTKQPPPPKGEKKKNTPPPEPPPNTEDPLTETLESTADGNPRQPNHNSLGDFMRTTNSQEKYSNEVFNSTPSNYTHEPELLFAEFLYTYKHLPPTDVNHKYLKGISIGNFLKKYANEVSDDVRQGLENDLAGYPDAVIAIVMNADGSMHKVKKLHGRKGDTIIYNKINDANGNIRQSGYDKIDLESIRKIPRYEELTDDEIYTQWEENQTVYQTEILDYILGIEDGVRLDINTINPGKVLQGETSTNALEAFGKKSLSKDEVVVAVGGVHQGVAVQSGLVYFNVDGKLSRAIRETLDESDVERATDLLRALAFHPLGSKENGEIYGALKNLMYLKQDGAYKITLNYTKKGHKKVLNSIGYGTGDVQTGSAEPTFIKISELLDDTAGNHKLDNFQSFLRAKYYQVEKDLIGQPFVLRKAELTRDNNNNITGATLVEERRYSGTSGYINYLTEPVGSKKGRLTTKILPEESTREGKLTNPNRINQSISFSVNWRRAEESKTQQENKVSEPKSKKILGPVSADDAAKENKKLRQSMDAGKKHVEPVTPQPATPTKPVQPKSSKQPAKPAASQEEVSNEELWKAIEDASKESGIPGFNPEDYNEKNRVQRSADEMVPYAEEVSKLREILPDIDVVETSHNMARVDATFETTRTSARIVASGMMGKGTMYHEAFHVISMLFTTPKERGVLYNSVRKALGNSVVEVQEGGKSTKFVNVKGKDMTDAQAEEYLAEEFKDYMLMGPENYKFGTDITKKNIFQRLWDYIKKLVLPKSMWNNPTDIILKKFEEIATSKYYMKDRLNFENFTAHRVGSLSESSMVKFTENINYLFFDLLSRQESIADGFTNVEKWQDSVYTSIAQIIVHRIKNGANELLPIAQNWTELVKRHKNYLRQYGFKVTTAQLLEDINDDSKEDSAINKGDNYAESNKVDFRETIPSPVKLLIAGLPRKTIKNGKTVDITHVGLRRTADYGKSIAILQKSLANMNTFGEMATTLLYLEKIHPQFATLVDTLGIDRNSGEPFAMSNTAEQVKLQGMFFTVFHKRYVDYISGLVKQDGGNWYNLSNEEENTNRQIRDTWKENARRNVKKFPNVLSIKDDSVIINKTAGVSIDGNKAIELQTITSAVLDKYSTTNKGKVDVYKEVLGIMGIALPPGFDNLDVLKNAIDFIFSSIQKHDGVLTVEDLYNPDVIKANKEIKQLVAITSVLDPSVHGMAIYMGGQVEYATMDNCNLGKVFNDLRAGDRKGKYTPFDGTSGNYGMYGSNWHPYITQKEGDVREVIIRNVGKEVGDKVDISEAKHPDYVRSIINNVLTGVFPYLRSAARKVENAFDFGKHYIAPNFANGEVARVSMLLEHLKGDMLELLAIINTPEAGRLVRRGKHKTLGFFRDLIPQSIVDSVLEYDGKLQPDEFLPTIDAILAIKGTAEVINSALKQFALESDKRTWEHWEENGIIRKDADGREDIFNLLGVDNEIIKKILGDKVDGKKDLRVLNRSDIEKIISVFNYYVQESYLEQMKLITGNPLVYQSKDGSSGLFKRTTTFASTIGGTIVDNNFHEYLDNNMPRLDGRSRTEIRREVTHRDVLTKVSNKMYKFLESTLDKGREGKKSRALPFSKMTITDGAGWATLDGYRDMMLRMSPQNWTDREERSWQYAAQIFASTLLKMGAEVNNNWTLESYKEAFGKHLPKTFTLGDAYFNGEKIDIKDIDNLGFMGTKKTQATGMIMNEELRPFNAREITKHSMSLLNPLDYLDNKAVLLFLHEAMQNGIDFFNPESAKKAEIVGNDDGTVYEMFTDKGLVLDNAPVTELNWADMGQQNYINDETQEGRVTMSTQMNRTLFMNGYDSGKLSESHKELNDLYKERHDIQRALILKNFTKLLDNLGLTLDESTNNSYKLVESEKFFNELIKGFQQRNTPLNIVDGIQAIMNANMQVFDTIPSKIQVVNALHGLVRTNVVSLKTNGEMLVAVSPAIHEHGKAIKDRSFSLNAYTPRTADGAVADSIDTMETLDPMDVMVRLPKKLVPYVIRNYAGKTFEEKLANFNDDVMSGNIFRTEPDFREILYAIGVRIPTSGMNTLEAMRIKKFLHPLNGAVIVVSGLIVAKSGSDFDIDKLTSYLANFDVVNNRIIYNRLDSKKTLEGNSIKALQNRLNEVAREIILHKSNAVNLLTPDSAGIIDRQAKDVVEGIVNRNKNPEHIPEVVPTDVVPVHNLFEAWYSANIAKHHWASMQMTSRGAINAVSHIMTQVSPIVADNTIFVSLFKDISYDDGNLHMGHIYDSEGNIITDTNSAILSGSVDATKQNFPSIFIINLTPRTANSYFMLNRMGTDSQKPIGFNLLTNFFTSPVIKRFTRESDMNESIYLQANTMKVIDKEKNKSYDVKIAKSKLNIVKSITGEHSRKFLYEYAEDYLRSNDSNRKEKEALLKRAIEGYKKKYGEITQVDFTSTNKIRQNAVLEAYLYYIEMGKLLGEFHLATRPDSGLTKDTNTVKIRQRKLNRLRNSGFFNRESLDGLFDNTYIGEYQKVHEETLKLFKEFFILERHPEFEDFLWGENGLITFYENPVFGTPETKLVNVVYKLQNAFMTYLLQNADFNGKPVHDRIEEMLEKKGSTLADRLLKIKDIEPDNIAIREMVAMHREFDKRNERHLSIDYIKLFNRKMTTEESNSFTESIKELLGSSDVTVKEFAEDLVIGSILQSGVQRSPISFFELLPAQEYHNILSGLLENIVTNWGRADIFKKDVERNIMANLYRDSDVVHRQFVRRNNMKRSKDGKRFFILKSSSGGYHHNYITVSVETYRKRANGNSIYDLVLFEKVYQKSGNARFEEMETKGYGMRMYDARPMKNTVDKQIDRTVTPTEPVSKSVSTAKNLGKKDIFTVKPVQKVDMKAIAKASIATQFIGFAEDIKDSSTELYRTQAGNLANTGNYNENDVIFVSIVGKRGDGAIRKSQQDRTIREALRAIEKGATLITDNKQYVESNNYNEGERRLHKNLEHKGHKYSEVDIDSHTLGVWNKNTGKDVTNPDITNLFKGKDAEVKDLREESKDANKQCGTL